MPFVTTDNTRLFYRMEGSEGRPVLIMSHSLGADQGMWAPQAPDLLPHFRVLLYDTRGHGASESPTGEYTIERLGRDVLTLADVLGIPKFFFCGLSMGGAIGQWIALNARDRLLRLVLANTSPLFVKANLEARRKIVLQEGTAAVADAVMQRFFLPETLARGDPYANAVRHVMLGTNRTGYAGCCAAIRDVNFSKSLPEIRVPTLVVSGDRDESTPWTGHGEILAREIPGARAVHLPTAHLSNIDRPRSFTAALLDFLLPPAETPGGPLQAGDAIRRAVHGDAHVERSQAAATDFTRDFQNLLTSYAWGTIWTRPGLSWRTRRLLVLTTMAALGRWEEFRLHVRTGLMHELEPCDLKEALLQAAIYAGVPAANTGFQIANEEIEKIGKAQVSA